MSLNRITTGIMCLCLLGVLVVIMFSICIGISTPSKSPDILVSILGVLVTALMGWQIYTLIDLHNTRESFEKMKDDIKREINSHVADTYANFADVYCFQSEYYYRTFCLLQRIVYLSKNKEYDKCEQVAQTILKFSLNHEIEQFQHDMIYDLIEQVENPNKIKSWRKLCKFIDTYFKLKEKSEDEKEIEDIVRDMIPEKDKTDTTQP